MGVNICIRSNGTCWDFKAFRTISIYRPRDYHKHEKDFQPICGYDSVTRTEVPSTPGRSQDYRSVCSRLRYSGLRVTDRKGGSANRLAWIWTALYFAKLDGR